MKVNQVIANENGNRSGKKTGRGRTIAQATEEKGIKIEHNVHKKERKMKKTRRQIDIRIHKPLRQGVNGGENGI